MIQWSLYLEEHGVGGSVYAVEDGYRCDYVQPGTDVFGCYIFVVAVIEEYRNLCQALFEDE